MMRRRRKMQAAVFSALIERHRTRAAVRRYAERLGPQLRQDYGASVEYTPAQIAASVRRAGLAEAFVRYGYAGFLGREAFALLELAGDYATLRAELRSHTRSRPSSSASDPPPEVAASVGIGDASHHSAF
jgi:hypothetical protein